MNEVKSKSNDYALRGKELLYNDLFEKYYVRLCYYAQTFVLDFDMCRDIVQDLFVKLWEIEWKNFSEEEIDKFLYRSVKNRCLDHLRKQKVRQNSRTFILERLLEQEELFVPQFELDELAQKIENALEALSDQTLTIFKMNRQDEKTYEEIADELNISVKGVEYHMSKALAILRCQLKDYLPLIACLSMFIDKS